VIAVFLPYHFAFVFLYQAVSQLEDEADETDEGQTPAAESSFYYNFSYFRSRRSELGKAIQVSLCLCFSVADRGFGQIRKWVLSFRCAGRWWCSCASRCCILSLSQLRLSSLLASNSQPQTGTTLLNRAGGESRGWAMPGLAFVDGTRKTQGWSRATGEQPRFGSVSSRYSGR
jgi:hypothetical protein